MKIEIEPDFACFISRSLELRARDIKATASRTIALPDNQKTRQMQKDAEWQLRAAEYAFTLVKAIDEESA